MTTRIKYCQITSKKIIFGRLRSVKKGNIKLGVCVYCESVLFNWYSIVYLGGVGGVGVNTKLHIGIFESKEYLNSSHWFLSSRTSLHEIKWLCHDPKL
jgi:hypothetical protein